MWLQGEEVRYDAKMARKFRLESRGAISLSIKDSGVGMSPDNLSQLFQEGTVHMYISWSDLIVTMCTCM